MIERGARIDQLALMMHLTPLSGGADLFRASDGKWWLISCQEGDQPLPQTGLCDTAAEALDVMEAWIDWAESSQWRNVNQNGGSLMERGPHHVQPTISKVCRICGQEFAAKRSNTQVCYEPSCRSKMKKQYDAAKRERLKNEK